MAEARVVVKLRRHGTPGVYRDVVLGDHPFPIVDASSWEALSDEPMGSKAKEWLVSPDGHAWLFKWVREKEDKRRGMREFGEDWAEKVSAEIAASLGIPAARVELGSRHGRRGSLSRSVLPNGGYDLVDHELVHGNELLQRLNPAYDKTQTREAAGYTLDAVWEVLEAYGPSPGMPAELTSATDVFVGYLMFDAVLANTDRHHENWAVVQHASGTAWLAPSYDHATCLGFQEPDDRKVELLDDDRALRRWTERGRSNHFEGKPSLLELTTDGLARCPPQVRRHWLGRLASLGRMDWQTTIARVPNQLMSQPDRMFATVIIGLNRERILDACRPH